MRGASIMTLASALAAGVLAVACGSGNAASPAADAGEADSSTIETGTVDTGTADTGSARDSGASDVSETGGYPAFVPTDVPQVADAGGPVMTAPKVLPIFYAQDNSMTVTSIKDFLSKLPGSTYWKSWATEYGVGDVTILAPVTLNETLGTTWDDSQIQADLATRLSGGDAGDDAGDPAFPAADGNTIYAYFFPPGVNITENGGGPPPDAGADAGFTSVGSCVVDPNGYGGYHSDITMGGGQNVSYAVMPRCMNFGNLTGLDAVTGPASHELAEAASDPFPSGNPAFSTTDAPHGYWSRLNGGGEIGDMCENLDTSFVKFPPAIPYTVQRIWSNKAALAGTDPCVPLPAGDVYFQTYPVMPNMITLSSRGMTVQTKGADIPVGGSKTIEMDLASSAPTSGPWTVRIIDSSSTGTAYLTAAFQECSGQATCTGQNGDKLHMKITVVAAGRRNTEPFFIESKLASGTYALWAGVVGLGPDGG